MDNILTYKRFGEKAVLIEWPPIINAKILNDILLFKEKISALNNFNYVDLIQGYNSLTIVYRDFIIDFEKAISVLKSIYTNPLQIKTELYFEWEIPVCYDLEFGFDLVEISQQSNLLIDEIIEIHSEAIYNVAFIGFLPGFLYLSGLNEKLFFDRKPNPRLKVAKGTVAIGGKQTGVYPSSSPGGWNILGKTPVNFFNIEKDNPCFAKAGDFIKFNPISVDEFYQLEKEIAANNYQLVKYLRDA